MPPPPSYGTPPRADTTTWAGAATAWLRDTAWALADLVVPADCAGCGAADRVRSPLCPTCTSQLAPLRPAPTRPDPAPPGFPPCWALGPYADPLKALLLAYKERGRHALTGLLGDHLASVVAAAGPSVAPVLLVPVPATAAAARQRYGDHVRRLATRAARTLRASGQPAEVCPAFTARPRPDSAGLDAAARARAAAAAFVPVAARLPALRRTGTVVLVDDIVTTGATLAALGTRLAGHGVRVDAAAVLAATRRRPTGRQATDNYR